MESTRKHRISVLILDFDGTLWTGRGGVSPRVLSALGELRASHVRLVLVTGRCLPELRPLIDPSLFDVVVAENGALLIAGGTRMLLVPEGWEEERRRLAALRRDIGCEEAIVSLERGLEAQARATIDPSRASLELNKDRIMILPRGVSKASGVRVALEKLGASKDETMCVGDAENDLAMFSAAHLRVAVQNSVDELKRAADYVTQAEDGEGVLEAIAKFIRPQERPS